MIVLWAIWAFHGFEEKEDQRKFQGGPELKFILIKDKNRVTSSTD